MSEVEDAFIEDEAELPRKVTWDMRPSKEEVELHNTTHLPYRSWCPHCLRGKARRRAHMRKRRKERGGIPVISLDYMWLKGKKGEGSESEKGNPILVVHCRETRLTWSRVVLKKGVDPCSV